MPHTVHAVVGSFAYLTYAPNGTRTRIDLPRTHRLTQEQAGRLLAIINEAETLPVPEYRLNRWATAEAKQG